MSDSVRPHRRQPTRLPAPGILQARTLEWVAISFSNAWKWKVKVKSLSSARLLATPWTAAYQAPPSMRFPRQEYWSGVPLPSPTLSYPEGNNHDLAISESFPFTTVGTICNILKIQSNWCKFENILSFEYWSCSDNWKWLGSHRICPRCHQRMYNLVEKEA